MHICGLCIFSKEITASLIGMHTPDVGRIQCMSIGWIMISHSRLVMLILLCSTLLGAGFLLTLRAQLHHAWASPRRVAGRPNHSASNEVECIRRPVDAQYFAIYYNDVYEVDLPQDHRFPMEKYRIVREGVQAKIDSLSGDEKGRVRCGELIERKSGIAYGVLPSIQSGLINLWLPFMRRIPSVAFGNGGTVVLNSWCPLCSPLPHRRNDRGRKS